jgi:hypothetical protein
MSEDNQICVQPVHVTVNVNIWTIVYIISASMSIPPPEAPPSPLICLSVCKCHDSQCIHILYRQLSSAPCVCYGESCVPFNFWAWMILDMKRQRKNFKAVASGSCSFVV